MLSPAYRAVGRLMCTCSWIALIDGGVAAGLSHEDARGLAVPDHLGCSTDGSKDGPAPPQCLKNLVTSPAGTTAAGLTKLESSGIRGQSW